MGIETRIVDFNNAEKLTEVFKDVDPVILISMPFVGPKRRETHKIAIDAAVAAGVNKLVYTSIVGARHEDINAYEVNDHVWTERYIKKTAHPLFDSLGFPICGSNGFHIDGSS